MSTLHKVMFLRKLEEELHLQRQNVENAALRLSEVSMAALGDSNLWGDELQQQLTHLSAAKEKVKRLELINNSLSGNVFRGGQGRISGRGRGGRGRGGRGRGGGRGHGGGRRGGRGRGGRRGGRGRGVCRGGRGPGRCITIINNY